MQRNAMICLTSIIALSCSLSVQAEPVSLPTSEDLVPAGWFQYWSLDLNVSEGDEIGAIHVVDDSVYVTSVGGEVYSVQTHSGLLRWIHRICDRRAKLYTPSHFDSPDYEYTFSSEVAPEGSRGPRNTQFDLKAGTPLTLLPSFSGVYMVERYSGQVVLFLPKMHPLGGSPVVDGKYMYIGSSNGHFYSEDWTIISRGKPYTRWQVKTDGPVMTMPWLVDSDKLIFSSEQGRVYCCTRKNRKLIWEFRVPDVIEGRPAVSPDRVFVASMDRSLYCLDRVTGQKKWRRRLPEMLSTGPVLAGDTVYQYCPGYGVYAIGAEDSAILWQHETGTSFICRNEGKVFLRTHAGLSIVDEKTGKELNRIPLGSDVMVALNQDNASLYMVSSNGHVLCAKPKGTPRLTAADIQAAHQTLHRKPTKKKTTEEEKKETTKTGEDGFIDFNDPLRSRE